MDEKTLIAKWKDLGYVWASVANGDVILRGYYTDFTFCIKYKEIKVSHRSFCIHYITKEVLDLINQTVEWLGWNK